MTARCGLGHPLAQPLNDIGQHPDDAFIWNAMLACFGDGGQDRLREFDVGLVVAHRSG
jgi:hypothetical protein